MAITVKHKFVSAIPDGADATIVRPSNWNDDHDLVGLGTIAEQNANNVTITGGTVSNSTLTSDTVSNNLQFTPTTAPTYAEGLVWYDSTEKALAYYNDSSALAVHVSQDLIVKVINNTGSTIPNGSPVYVTGTSSGQTYPNVALAKADIAATSSVIGLTNGAIANGAIGYVTSQGIIDNVNTGTFTVGQVLYLSPYSAGQIMNTIPPTGITVQIGVATFINSSTGHIYVKQTTPLAVPASIITGTLGVANGGTGATTLTGLVVGNGTSAMTTVTAPSGAVVGTTDTQTLTNKTLTSPVISTISNTGLLTLPTSTGTLLTTTGSGTGLIFGTGSLSLAGNVTYAGAFTQSFTATANTAVTLPTTGTLATLAGTETLTNKRVTPRVLASTANSATPTLNTDSYDMMVITGQSVAITNFTTNLTGTPTNGQKLWISITGTGAIAITWGTSFEASTIALPVTTVGTARLDIGFVYNVATSDWRCVAVA